MTGIQDEFNSSLSTLVSLSRDLRVSLFFLQGRNSSLLRKKRAMWSFRTAFVVVGLLANSSFAWSQVTGHVSRQLDSTHFEFKGLKDWSYEINKTNETKLKVTLPMLDEKSQLLLRSWSDPFIKSIEVNNSDEPSKIDLTLHMTSRGIEHFDYLTDEPSRLIIDFYTPDKPKVAPALSPTVKPKGKEVAGKQKDKGAGSGDKTTRVAGDYSKVEGGKNRSPAGDELLEVSTSGGSQKNLDADQSPQEKNSDALKGIFDGGDPNFNRFRMKDSEVSATSIIANRNNIYLRFPQLEMPISKRDEIEADKPEFVINEKSTKENKIARFALGLYERDRRGAFQKTYEFFKKAYPHSEYLEILDHLNVEIIFKNYKDSPTNSNFDHFENAVNFLIDAYPNSPLNERNKLILGYSFLERNDALGTLQFFDNFLKENPDSKHSDQARKAMASASSRINKHAEAYQIYEVLSQNAMEPRNRVEAVYRLGDVLLNQGKKEEAAAAYIKALEKYPEFESYYPNVHYNLGEALFWIPDQKKSLDNFISFLAQHPRHHFAPYAMTRIGELLEILGADQSKVMGAFIENYFRYQGTPGADVSRIRMISQRMKVMKEKEIKVSLAELERISKNSSLPRIDEFVTLMIADGFHRRGEYTKSLNLLIEYYQKNPTSTDLAFFKKRILKNISDEINQLLENSDFIKTLQFHQSFSKTWLRGSDRMDIPYFVGRSFEQAGVYGEAQRIFEATLAGLERIKGTPEELERRVNEHLPSFSTLALRLAAVNLAQRKYEQAMDNLKNVVEPITQEEEVEKMSLTSKLLEEKGDTKGAIQVLEKWIARWDGNPELKADLMVRFADLLSKMARYSDTEKSVDSVFALDKQGIKVKSKTLLKAFELKAKVLEEQGKELAAVETYMTLFGRLGSQVNVASYRFRAGEILFERGDFSGAERVWASLPNQADDFYRRMANDKMAHSQWKQDYKKYLNRIPAMKSAKE